MPGMFTKAAYPHAYSQMIATPAYGPAADPTEKKASDIESDGEGQLPASGTVEDDQAEDQVNGELRDEIAETQASHHNADKGKEEGEDDDEDDEDDEDNEDNDEVPEGEYEVEAIRDHRLVTRGRKKTLRLLIKWKGYSEEENTWEPEANLNELSQKLVETYFAALGGRPDTETKPGTKKRKSTSSLPDQPAPAKKPKRKQSSEDFSKWIPVSKDWEPEIERIDTVDCDVDTKKLNAYIIFKNGKRTKVGMDMVYKHCPRAMLKFYEGHLKFT